MSSAYLSKFIWPPLQNEMAQLTSSIEAQLANWPSALLPVIVPLLLGRGKRLRPQLALLSGLICEITSPELRAYAMAVEFLHNASLLHDDIIDQGETRRGEAAAHCTFGVPAALLAGNFLYSEAVQLVHSLNQPDVTDSFLSTARQLIIGECIQLTRAEWTSWEAYRSLAFLKAGALVESALLGGAKLAKAPSGYQIALQKYSYHLGILLQLTDDLIDTSLPKAADRMECLKERDLHRLGAKNALIPLPSGPCVDALRALIEELYMSFSSKPSA